MVSQIVIEKFCDVFANHGIAVNVDGFINIGKHFGDEQPEIGGFGIVVPDGQPVAEGTQIGAHIVKANADILPLHPVNLLHAGRGNVGVQNVDFILSLRIGVFQN